MATRCYIFTSKDNADIVKGIYCHHDGYVDGVGKTLKEHYDCDTLAYWLIELGNISALRKSIEQTKEEAYEEEALECSLTKFLEKESKEYFIEYVYLRKNGKWFVAKLDFKNKQYTPFKEITKAYLDSL
ncbi:hypothetical protein [Helicobacter mesocricetorum]|uniref:hypothetical protein n=1 Tax=Helicobacter mesocricetorum TaxID=87012 RepID=UPI000CF0A962|nr:hypothetical protein [Helicobacter mesocricetorum]